MKQIFADRHPDGCTFVDCELVKEKRFGFRSQMVYRCKKCEKLTTLDTDKVGDSEMPANKGLVSGVFATGGTFTMRSSATAGLNMPCIHRKTWQRHEEDIADNIEAAALEAMLEAGREEYRLAVEAGDVDADGVPFTTVIADGMWSKRTYGSKYDAKSGTATIIGFRTGKVLWTSTMNKVCAWAAKAGRAPRRHTCAKKYTGPSTGMEAAIIAEGFKCSMEMHGLRFDKLVGDGDSSVTSRLLQIKPYGALYLVEKVECKNHLMRNLRRQLDALANNTHLPIPEGVTKQEMVHLRKTIGNHAAQLSFGVSKASEHRGGDGEEGKGRAPPRRAVHIAVRYNIVLFQTCPPASACSACAATSSTPPTTASGSTADAPTTSAGTGMAPRPPAWRTLLTPPRTPPATLPSTPACCPRRTTPSACARPACGTTSC
ncbi:hypothetical protein ONE63_003458 [Megalurothrips usitatus]|uniref:Mutator-like transposase domain-containing protein n=1 Tax=Megalurothrips usitatus TaxID=439358 RepID=A0AAV7XAA8_9NEOP|nr:hypothetical protein ONE63_003458 [Megalurothrips usitatus]